MTHSHVSFEVLSFEVLFVLGGMKAPVPIADGTKTGRMEG